MTQRRRTGLLTAAIAAAFAAFVPALASAQTPTTQCIVNVAAQGTADAITSAQLPCGTTTNLVILTAAATNVTTTPTYAPQGSPPLPIKRADGTAVVPGDILSGYVALLSSTGTSWVLLNPATGGSVFVATGASALVSAQTRSSWQLTPYDFGAVGDGVADDTNALAAWAARPTQTLATDPYCPPGVYNTSKKVVFAVQNSQKRAPVWRFSPSCRIVLTVPADAVVQFGNGNSFTTLVHDGVIEGGDFDANYLAPAAVFLPFFNNVDLKQVHARNALVRYFRVGDVNSLSQSFGLVFSGGTNRDAPYISIASVTQANPAVVTSAAPHGLVSGQTVWIANSLGMTQINSPSWFAVTVIDPTHFSLNNVDSSAYPPYTGSGRFAPTVSGSAIPASVTNISNANPGIVTTATPHNFSVGQNVTMYGLTTSSFSLLDGVQTVGSVIDATHFTLSGVDTTALGAWGSGVAGVAALVAPVLVSGVSNANPAVVTTSAPHNLTAGGKVFIDTIKGMGGSLYGIYTVGTVNDSTHFTLSGTDSTSFGAYVSGGEMYPYPGAPLTGIFLESAANTTLRDSPSVKDTAIGLNSPGIHPYAMQITNFHFWNTAEAGPIQTGFALGGNNMMVTSVVDGPVIFAWRFYGFLNDLSANYCDTSPSRGVNNTQVCGRLESTSQVRAVNNSMVGTSNANILADWDGFVQQTHVTGQAGALVTNLIPSVAVGVNTPGALEAQLAFVHGTTTSNLYGLVNGFFNLQSSSGLAFRCNGFTLCGEFDDVYHFGFPELPLPGNVTSCGTSPGAATGSDVAGSVVEGTTATGCVISFSHAYHNAPRCTANGSVATPIGVSVSISALTLSHASQSGMTATWQCYGT